MGRLYDAYVEVGPRFAGFGDIKNQGAKAGREYGKALADAAVKAAEANARNLGQALAKARSVEADAAGKVRVAEAKLNEVRADGKAKASQVAAAEEALASAQRKSASAADSAKDAAEALGKAQKRVSDVADSEGKKSGNRFSRAFKGGLSRMGGDREGKAFATRFGVGLNGAIGGIVSKSAGVFAAGFAALKGGQFLTGAISSASDLGETMSKSAAVFGSAQSEINKFAATSATALGQSKTEAVGAAAQFGNMFNQLGIGQKPAARMSTQMVQLASDFASFHNADITEVLEAQQAAFRGEYDSVQKFVPTINAAAVEQEGLRLKLAGSSKELTAQDKAIATQSLLMKGAGKAVGDFARTSGGLANQQRILKAQFADSKAELGQKLLPVATKFFQFLNNTAIPGVKALSDRFKNSDFAKGLGGAFQQGRLGVSAFGAALQGEGVTSDGFVGTMERIGVAVRSAFGFFKTEVLPRLREFGGYIKSTVLPIVGELVQDRLAKMGQMFVSIKKAIQDNGPELAKLGGALLSVGKFLIEDVLPPLEKLQNNVFPQVGQGAGFLINVIGALVKAFEATKGAISTAFAAVKGAISTAVSAVSTAVESVKGAFSTAFAAVSGAVGSVVNAVKTGFSTAVGFVKSTWSTIVTAVSGPVTAVLGVLNAVWSRIEPILVLPFYIAKSVISTTFQGIATVFTATKDWVVSKFSAAWSAVSGVLSGPVNTALGGIRAGWSGITAAFGAAKTWVTGAFAAAWSVVKSVVSVPLSLAKGALDTTWAGIKSAFGAARDFVKGAFARAWSGLKSILVAPIDLAKKGITIALGAAKGGLQWAFSQAVASIGRIWDRLKALVKAPISFVVDTVLNKGLIGGFNWIADKFQAPTIAPIPWPPKGWAAGGYFNGRLPGPPSDKDNLVGYAKGGQAFGLAGGEFIVNARQTAKHLPMLQAVNAGREGFADGGLLGKLKGAVTDGFMKGKQFIGDAADFVKNPADWLKNRFSGPLSRLKELGDSAMARILKAVPPKLAGDIVGKAKDILKGLFGGPDTPVGKVVTFRGKQLNQRTIAMLLSAEAALGKTFHITQGSYSTSVAASGGTHAGGGAMDTDNAGAGWMKAQNALRGAGFASWWRHPWQGPWNDHIHSIALGDPTASPSAKAQMTSYRNGGDGLGALGMAKGGRVGAYADGAWKILTDQLALVHKGEMVVPAKSADPLRQLLPALRLRGKLHQLHEAHQTHLAHVAHLNHVDNFSSLGRARRAIRADTSGAAVPTRIHPDDIRDLAVAVAGVMAANPPQVLLDGRRVDQGLSRRALGGGY